MFIFACILEYQIMKKLLIALIIIITSVVNAKASHLMGGEITYVHVGGDDYEVTLIVYRDCDGISVGQNQTVTFESASCGQNFQIQFPLLTTIDVSQVCGTATTTCNGGTLPGTEQWVYKATVTMPPCTDWLIHWNSGARNPAITNLVNPSSTNLFIMASLDNVVGAFNNSPQYLALPTPYLCAGQLNIFNHSASDLDGDSLYYTLAQPLTTPGPPGTPIPYAGAYTINDPITTVSGMNLTPTTGEMCFTPVTGQAQICVVSVIVSEYRNNALIGSQIREMQVVVSNSCAGNIPPTAGGVAATCGGSGGLVVDFAGPSVTRLDSNSFVMCPDDSLCFSIAFSDANPADNISIISNIAASIPTANFTITGNGTPNASVSFCWVPTALDSGINIFGIQVEDDACPIKAVQYFTYDITVYDQPYAGPDQIICGTQGAQLLAQGGAGYTWHSISGDPVIVGTNFSCNPCDNPVATPSVTTTYVVTSSLTAACENTDTVTIVRVPDFTPDAIGDTILCDYLNRQLDVNITSGPLGIYTYSWDNGATLNNDLIQNPIASPTQTTTYAVTVTSPQGCVKVDSAIIGVVPPPTVVLVPGDSATYCEGEIVNFDVSLAAINDDFNAGFDPTVWGTVSGASVGNPCVAYNGTALNFDAANRDLITNGASVTNCTTINFCMWVANNSSTGTGCENADMGEDIELNYSINGGATWVNLVTYATGDWDNTGPYNNAWQCFTVTIPAAAQTGNTMFQWTQIGGYGTTIDNWALDDISVSCGGNSAYNYSWTPPTNLNPTNVNNPTFTALATETYTVTITDTASGCSIDRSQTIVVVPDYTIATTQNDSTVCLGETVDFTVTTNPAGTYNYLWTPTGIMNDSTSATPTATFVTPGNNMITVTVDNGGGCIKTDTMYVSVSASYTPTISIITPDSTIGCSDTVQVEVDLGGGIPATSGPSATNICSGPTTQNIVGVGTNNISAAPSPYYGFYEDGRIQMIYTAAEINAAGFIGGKITEMGWFISSVGGASYTNLTIKMGVTALNNFNATTTFVPGLTQVFTTATFTPAGTGWTTHTLNTAYDWDGVSNLMIEVCFDNNAWTSTDEVAQTATTDKMTLYDYTDGAAGCTLNTPFNSTQQNNRPNIRFTDCPTIPDPNIYYYSWNPNISISDSTEQNPFVFPSTTTTYTVTVTDTLGGCFDTDSILITVNSFITPTVIGSDVICNGDTTGQILASATGPNPPFSYSFYDNAVPANLLQTTPNVSADSLENIGIGDYLVTITDTSGCYFDTLITINEPTPVTLVGISPDTVVCINGSGILYGSGSGGTGPIDLMWDNALVGSGPHTVTPVADSTTYIVYAQDSLGCLSVDSVSVLISWLDSISLTPISATDTTICPDSLTTLTLTASGGFIGEAGNIGDYTFEWYDGANNLIGTTQDITVTTATNGETYTVIVSDSCSTPSVTATFDVFIHPLPQASFTVDTNRICVPYPVEFTNTTPSLVGSVLWSFGDGNTSTSNATPVSNNFTFSNTFVTTLTVTSDDGCKGFAYDTIYGFDLPIADFSVNPVDANVNNTEITFTNLSFNNDTNYWSFTYGDPLSSMGTDPIVTFPTDSPGIYPVQLIVANGAGCRDTTIGRFVEIKGIYLFYIPNSFTPDGNGINDVFRPLGKDVDFVDNYNMQIFNRWGTLVFETSVIEEGWDGTYKGAPVSDGVYIWKIKTKELYENLYHEDYGHVTLIR